MYYECVMGERLVKRAKLENILRVVPIVLLLLICLWGIGNLRRSAMGLRPGEYLPSGINYLTSDSLVLADERFHFDQIFRIVHGDLSFSSQVTTLPGYHVVIAIILRLLGGDTITLARLVSLFFSLLSVLVIYKTLRVIDKSHAYAKTMQYLFFPLVAILFPLVYTDIFAVLVVMTGFYFLVSRRYFWSGIFGMAGVLVRQNNIVWVGFFMVIAYLQENTISLSFPRLISYLKQNWMYFLTAFLFLVFIRVNGGVSMSQQELHPLKFVYTGNIYFLLFTFFFLFLPLAIAYFPKVVGLLGRPLIGLAAVFGVFVIQKTLVIDHPYNFIPMFIRNDVLMFINGDAGLRWVFGIICVYSLLVLAATKFIRKEFYILYPFVVLVLLPEWLIETRYYILPAVFYLLLRKTEKGRLEYAVWGWFAACSVILFWGVFNGKFFI